MYLMSKDRHKFRNFSWESLWSYISNYNLFELFQTYFSPFYEKPIILFILLGLPAAIFLRKKTNSHIRIYLTILLFPVIYDFIFQNFINWPTAPRYWITLSLVLILFTTMSVKNISKVLKWRTFPFFGNISMIVVFMIMISIQILSVKNKTQFDFPYQDKSTEKAYLYLKEKAIPKDIALDFHLSRIVGYQNLEMYLNKLIFYRSNIHPQVITKKYIKILNRSEGIYYIDSDTFSKKQGERSKKKQ